MINGFKLGCKRSKQDERNHKFCLTQREKEILLPESFQLKVLDALKIFNQGQLSSCTANAIAQQIQIKTDRLLTISRLFQYFNSRLLENTYNEDSGANILDCYKALVKYKYIAESLYPYIESNVNEFPPKEIYIEASNNKSIKGYTAVPQDIYHIKYALAINKQPIVFGAEVFNTFQNLDSNYICPTPDPTKDTLLGGHALTIYSYDDKEQTVGIINSWGSDYGNKGTFKMKYDYILNPSLASDFWTVELGF